MSSAPRILGTSDTVTTCDHCGRSDLARTVALDFDGEVSYYGTTCAAKAFFPKSTGADVAKIASKKCHCGCGEYATIGTADGRNWHPGWKSAA
jgi:hypothetical protein